VGMHLASLQSLIAIAVVAGRPRRRTARVAQLVLPQAPHVQQVAHQLLRRQPQQVVRLRRRAAPPRGDRLPAPQQPPTRAAQAAIAPGDSQWIAAPPSQKIRLPPTHRRRRFRLGGCSGQRACHTPSAGYTGSRADSGIPPAALRQLHSLTHSHTTTVLRAHPRGRRLGAETVGVCARSHAPFEVRLGRRGVAEDQAAGGNTTSRRLRHLKRHPTSSQRHPASSQRQQASSQRHPARL
jgi:hypothetical protein